MTDAYFMNPLDGGDPTSIPLRTSMGSSRRTSMETRTSSHRSNSTRLTERKQSSSSKELAMLLTLEKSANQTLRLALEETQKEVAAQRRRAEEAETNLLEVTSGFVKANNERLAALQEAARAVEELELYRAQLRAAQREIDKARDMVREIDIRRVRAEDEAAKYKKSTRKLNEERLVSLAREEGRRQGFEEGMQRARAEAGLFDLDVERYVTPRPHHRLDPPAVFPDDDFYDDESRSDSQRDTQSSPDPFSEPMPQPLPTEPPNARSPPPPPPRTDEQTSPLPIPTPLPPRAPSRTDGDIHPVIIHNIPSSPRHPHTPIPPDGMIPLLDSDSRIRLPPSHELGPMPPIVEASPSPSQRNLEEPKIVPPPGTYNTNAYMMPSGSQPHHHHHHHSNYHQSSPESNSTTISQFDMLNNPYIAKHSPMSAIEEVASGFTSPNPPSMHGGQDLHRNTSVRSAASSHRSRTPTQNYRTPRAREEQLPDLSYQSTGGSRGVSRKASTPNINSRQATKTPPAPSPQNYEDIYARPFSPPGNNIYTNPHYQSSAEPSLRHANSMRSIGDPYATQTPAQRNRPPYAADKPPPFMPPEQSHANLARTSPDTTRTLGRKASLASAGSSSHTLAGRYPTQTSPAVPSSGMSTTLVPDDLAPIDTHSSRNSESSGAEIGVSIHSPTPPGSARSANEEIPQRPFNEFLSPLDAQRPLPMPDTTRPEQSAPLPTAPFGTNPTIGTPIPMNNGIFIPSSFSSSPTIGPARLSSPRSRPSEVPGPSLSPNVGSGNGNGAFMPGSFALAPGSPSSTNQPPVIPDPSLLGPADSDSESEDPVSSGMNSEANTLTTPPSRGRGLPQVQASARGKGRGRGTAKKKRR